MEDQRIAKFCANLTANFMAKINMYESSISEKNSVNFYLNFVDEILKYVILSWLNNSSLTVIFFKSR
jgi:hypothetical protein